MNIYYLTLTNELGRQTKINVEAEGKEQAIDKAMGIIWKRSFVDYMRIEKVDVVEDLGNK